jgi:hypothetical protein
MFGEIQKKAFHLLSENASVILTAGGVVGTVTTAVLTGRAAIKAHDIIENAESTEAIVESRRADHPLDLDPISTFERVKLTWPLFIPPVVAGVATIGSVVMANRISAQRAAALAALYGASQKQRDEYKTKLEEKLGIKKAETTRDELQQDRIDDKPVDKSVIIIGHGDVLCYDAFSDRYFKGSAESILKAEREVQNAILRDNECPLGTFYNELGLPKTHFDDMVGFNLQNSCNVHLSAMLSNDEPCLCIEFQDLPVTNFATDY